MNAHETNLYTLWQRQRQLRIRLTVVFIMIAGILLWLRPYSMQKISSDQTSQTSGTRSGILEKGTPNYNTLVPAGKNIKELGGWTRVSPPDHNPVYAYADKIGGVSLTVSEQPLPDTFKKDTDSAVESLSKDYGASRYITAGKVTVYIGTSAKGPQSIIFVKKNTLILIKSSTALNDEQWTGYIESMR